MMTKEGDRDVFRATEIRHVAATCEVAEGEPNSLTGCFNKDDMDGYYILTDKDSGEETIVTGIPALERHSTNHEVTVVGMMAKEGDRDIFRATEIRHVAATCSG
jgi:hypothetical protein